MVLNITTPLDKVSDGYSRHKDKCCLLITTPKQPLLSVYLILIINFKTNKVMKTRTEKFTVAVDKTNGNSVVAKNGNMCAVTEEGINVWFPKGAKLGAEITYKVHEKGDKFTAVRDSSRTKGQVMEDKCPQGKEDEPLYFKGEEVSRTIESVEFVGFAGEPVLSFQEKATFLASLGVSIKL